MPGIRVRENESFDFVLKKFKKQCEKAGIMSDVRSANTSRSQASS